MCNGCQRSVVYVASRSASSLSATDDGRRLLPFHGLGTLLDACDGTFSSKPAVVRARSPQDDTRFLTAACLVELLCWRGRSRGQSSPWLPADGVSLPAGAAETWTADAANTCGAATTSSSVQVGEGGGGCSTNASKRTNSRNSRCLVTARPRRSSCNMQVHHAPNACNQQFSAVSRTLVQNFLAADSWHAIGHCDSRIQTDQQTSSCMLTSASHARPSSCLRSGMTRCFRVPHRGPTAPRPQATPPATIRGVSSRAAQSSRCTAVLCATCATITEGPLAPGMAAFLPVLRAVGACWPAVGTSQHASWGHALLSTVPHAATLPACR